MSASARFRAFSTMVLAFTVAVILWGAYVRASGSGAGCGSHWPMCNGEVIPRARSAATVVEFTHRVTSGTAFMLVLAQLVWALRRLPRGHASRRAAGAAMTFMVTEALVGAALVKFEMVAGNKSIGRAAWMATHLVNTFALVASLVLTRWHAGAAAGARRAEHAPFRLLLAGLAGTVLVAISGAIAALGDTLFPARSLAEGLRLDASPTAHLFVRLRVWHPVLAVTVGGALLAITLAMVVRDRPRGARAAATAAAALVVAQLSAGLLNLALLAPVAMQIVHLLLADLVWIALVWLAATVRVTPARP